MPCVAPGNFKATRLFFAALAALLSAATYAIVTHAEYAKVADASGELYERTHDLFASLAAIPMPEAPANAPSLAAMRPIVLEFATLAITAATGWRAMRRDKNVPLR